MYLNGDLLALTKKQFDVLYAVSRSDAPQTQRELSESLSHSLGSINTVVRELEARGLIQSRAITAAGFEALSPYRVNNAVILAAGLSSRFAPISYEKPKGLLKVRGEILIERQIEQLIEAGITDITVVVGYRKEFFFYLREKYGVHITVNNEYATRNNNGSLWVVRNQLSNTLVCSSDDYFTENPFESHIFQPYYASQYIEGETDEWCITTGAGDRITDVSIGGNDSWVMLGHVYFDSEFSTEFVRVLEESYDDPEMIDKHWEAFFIKHVARLSMVKREYETGVIHEFDSLAELQDFDDSFIENIDSEVFDNIVTTLNCKRSEIHDFYPLKQGITNLSCHFRVGDEEYVYRHPGVGTEKMIDRHAEFAAIALAHRLGLDETFVAGDPEKGWKISRFIPESRNLDPQNKQELKRAMKMARRLHHSGEVLDKEFDFVQAGIEYERLLLTHGPIEMQGYAELREKVMRLKAFADADGFPVVPSHNDFFQLNFLVNEDGYLNLIDWEYAGMSDIANDFGTLTVCAGLSKKKATRALKYYFGRPPSDEEYRHFWAYVVFAGWCWYIWALAKEAEGDDVGEWLYIYYQNAVDNIDEVLDLYENAEVMSAV